MSGFYEELSEIFEIEEDEVTPDLNLEKAGWDSLAIVATIAAVDQEFGKVLDGEQLASCKTVGDIENLIKEL